MGKWVGRVSGTGGARQGHLLQPLLLRVLCTLYTRTCILNTEESTEYISESVTVTVSWYLSILVAVTVFVSVSVAEFVA